MNDTGFGGSSADRFIGGPVLVRIGIVSLLLGVVFFLYHYFGVTDIGYDQHDATRSVFRWIYLRWEQDRHDNVFAHSHWIPLVSLYLVWRQRRTLISLPRKSNLLGLGFIILSLALHWAGAKSEQTRISLLSLIGLSWSIPFYIAGWPVARRLIIPCAFLVFALPLNFFDSLSYPLRILAAALTTGIASGLGIEVSRIGSAVVTTAIPGFSVDLGDVRSSIFAVTAVVAFAVFCAAIMRSRPAYRIALIAAAIPLLVLANTLRGVFSVVAAQMIGAAAGMAFDRVCGGVLICVGTFGVIGVAAFLIQRRTGFAPETLSGTAPPAMSVRPGKAWLITLGTALLAVWWIPRHLSVTHEDRAGINLEIPDVLGPWSGGTILFCHNPEHGEMLLATDKVPGDPCPTCGWPLQEMSQIEKQLLPTDTVIRKKRYDDEKDQRRVYFTIVLSGERRSSIHRPEVCLVGPNSEIANSFEHTVTLADGHPLKVKILEMVLRSPRPDGSTMVTTGFYAYWFAGIGRETPSHLRRMMWMASDRLFHGRSYRWAYISLAGRRLPDSKAYLRDVDDFLREAYPSLANTPE